MRFTRRNFIKTIGAGAITMAAPGCTTRVEETVRHTSQWVERQEARRSSICRLCPGGCGLKIRVVDGRAVQVLGNPLHPVNRGGICPRGLAAIQRLYDPDRLRQPMQRLGPPGSGDWRAIDWDEALRLISEKLTGVRASGRPEGLVLLDGQEPGIGEQVVARFARYFGTPNHIRFRTIEPHRISIAHALMQGGDAPLGYDLSRASHILCFGTGLLESWISPVTQMRAVADLRGVERGNRTRIVVVEPRLSATAARADQWVPVRPGTEGALALGIAYVILRESLHDRAFLDGKTFGFEDWTDEMGTTHVGFKNLVLSQYNPRTVSEITGVRAETILSLAREFAREKPALAIGDPEFSWGTTDFYDRMAIHALNALTGNMTDSGTFAVQGKPPTTPLPEVPLDGTARESLARPRIDGAGEGIHFLSSDAVQELPGRIQARRPYPVEVLFLIAANPVFSHPAKEEFVRALAKVPLVVGLSPFMDESCELADLVLPETTFLERWDSLEARQHAGFSLVSVGEPAVVPIGEARDSLEVLLALAARLGDSVAAALPWGTTREIIEHSCRGLFEGGRGYVVSDPMEESFRRILERQGFRDPEFSTFDDFWTALRARGAWWDPTDTSYESAALIRTESKKFEFYSRSLERLFREAVSHRAGGDRSAEVREAQRLRAELGMEAEGDRLFLPHHESRKSSADETRYPLRFRPYTLLPLGAGEMANVSWIQEGLAVHLEATWDSWVEVNPITARDFGVRDGDRIWVESPKGRLQTWVRVLEGTMPGIVAMPLGQGHSALGRNARGRGANPIDLVENVIDARAGMAVLGQTPVRIMKA